MLTLPKLPRTPIRGPRAMPLLGTMGSLLRFFGDPVGTLLSLQRRFGDLVTLADGDPAMILALHPDHNRQILSDNRNFYNFAQAPLPVPKGSAPELLLDALTSMNGDRHKQHRRLLMPAFSKSALEGYRAEIIALTDGALGRLKAGDALDLNATFVDLTSRIALKCLFGVEPTEGEENLGVMATDFLAGLISPAAALFPYMLPGTPYRRFMKLSERLAGRMRAIIAERRARETGKLDMLSILIRTHDEDGTALTDSELLGHSAVMYVAGHETTAYTLGWTLFLLAQHPEILAEVARESRDTLGGGPPAPLGEGAQLPLLERVIKESQRLLPATPYLFIRQATAGFRLAGHDLPADTGFILSPLLTHRRAELYQEPLRFDPARWTTIDPSPYEYLPFGAGPRLCIGMGFAAQALRIVLPMLLARFAFELADGAKVSRKVQGITMGPKHGLPMRLLPSGAAVKRARVAGDIGELVALD
jgi:cytochrome P450